MITKAVIQFNISSLAQAHYYMIFLSYEVRALCVNIDFHRENARRLQTTPTPTSRGICMFELFYKNNGPRIPMIYKCIWNKISCRERESIFEDFLDTWHLSNLSLMVARHLRCTNIRKLVVVRLTIIILYTIVILYL